MRREDFEQMTARQVRMHAQGEGDVQRGKALYFGRPWRQVLDEMGDAGVQVVGELDAARVRSLYEGVSGS